MDNFYPCFYFDLLSWLKVSIYEKESKLKKLAPKNIIFYHRNMFTGRINLFLTISLSLINSLGGFNRNETRPLATTNPILRK
jgi:hypothetical protein